MPVKDLFVPDERNEMAERYLDGGHSKTSIAQAIYHRLEKGGFLLDPRQGAAYALASHEARAIGAAVHHLSIRRDEALMGLSGRQAVDKFSEQVILYLRDIRQDGEYELPNAGKKRAGFSDKFGWPRLWDAYVDAVNKTGQASLVGRDEFGKQFATRAHDIRRFEREFNRCAAAGELETIHILQMIREELDTLTFHKGSKEPACSPEWHDRALQTLAQSEGIQDGLIIAALGYDTHGKAATCYD